MEQIQVSMSVGANNPGTNLIIRVDDQIVWQGDPGDNPGKITHEFDDQNEIEHVISFELSGKTRKHTKIDSSGNIIEDLLVSVKDITFDGINSDPLVWDLAEYHHDFNGTKSPIVDKFYGDMGCNGAVKLKFTGPVYLWLLENM